MIDDCLYVAVGEVLAFNYLDVSLAAICELFDEFPLCFEVVSGSLDEVRLVMSWVYVADEGCSREEIGVVRVL